MSEIPFWDTNNTNSTKPSAGKIADGFVQSDRPPAEWVNWLFQQNGLLHQEALDKDTQRTREARIAKFLGSIGQILPEDAPGVPTSPVSAQNFSLNNGNAALWFYRNADIANDTDAFIGDNTVLVATNNKNGHFRLLNSGAGTPTGYALGVADLTSASLGEFFVVQNNLGSTQVVGSSATRTGGYPGGLSIPSPFPDPQIVPRIYRQGDDVLVQTRDDIYRLAPSSSWTSEFNLSGQRYTSGQALVSTEILLVAENGGLASLYRVRPGGLITAGGSFFSEKVYAVYFSETQNSWYILHKSSGSQSLRIMRASSEAVGLTEIAVLDATIDSFNVDHVEFGLLGGDEETLFLYGPMTFSVDDGDFPDGMTVACYNGTSSPPVARVLLGEDNTLSFERAPLIKRTPNFTVLAGQANYSPASSGSRPTASILPFDIEGI